MPMTTVNARIYVARIIGGGASSQESLDMADEAIHRTYQEWQARRFWRGLLKDTSLATSVPACTATVGGGNATVNAPSSAAFDFVNIGQTVTISGTAALAANTTVASFTRNADGTVATITLSNPFSGTTDSNATLTFSADIPIIAGQQEYNAPLDFNRPFTALLLVNKRTLVWRDQRWFDRIVYDQTTPAYVTDYTVYNPVSEITQNFGTKRIRFNHTADVNDTLRLRYYRPFNVSGTYIDVPDEYLYIFLDYARNVLLLTKRAQDDPEGYAKAINSAAEEADENDEQVTDDDDADQCMKSQWEMGNWNRALWHNGAFDPYRLF